MKTQIAAINEEISKLTTQFAQNLLLETKAFKLVLKTEEETAGLVVILKPRFTMRSKRLDRWFKSVGL